MTTIKRPGEERRMPAGTEPGVLARLVARQSGTLMFVAGLMTLLFGWAVVQKVQQELPVPTAILVDLCIAAGSLVLLGGLRFALRAKVAEVSYRDSLERDAGRLLGEARAASRKRARLSDTQRAAVEADAKTVEEALAARDWTQLESALTALDERLDASLSGHRKSTSREYAESIVIAVGVALLLRAFVFEAFKIPSGSMIPTLQVGDHIFVNKFIYGLRIPFTDVKIGMNVRKPQRGEVAVFKFPKDPDKDFIKRIVAVGGDTVEIRDNALFINGVAVPREPLADVPCEYEDFDELSQHWEHRRCDAWAETMDGHRYTTIFDRGAPPRSWPAVTVPKGAVFVMGDNRDNSHDSRFWGFVQFEALRGKAMVIWWSVGEPEGVRVGRIGHLIH